MQRWRNLEWWLLSQKSLKWPFLCSHVHVLVSYPETRWQHSTHHTPTRHSRPLMNASNYYEKRLMLLLENSLKELQAMKSHVHFILYKYHRSQCFNTTPLPRTTSPKPGDRQAPNLLFPADEKTTSLPTHSNSQRLYPSGNSVQEQVHRAQQDFSLNGDVCGEHSTKEPLIEWWVWQWTEMFTQFSQPCRDELRNHTTKAVAWAQATKSSNKLTCST